MKVKEERAQEKRWAEGLPAISVRSWELGRLDDVSGKGDARNVAPARKPSSKTFNQTQLSRPLADSFFRAVPSRTMLLACEEVEERASKVHSAGGTCVCVPRSRLRTASPRRVSQQVRQVKQTASHKRSRWSDADQ